MKCGCTRRRAQCDPRRCRRHDRTRGHSPRHAGRAGAFLGSSAPPGVAMAGDGEVQPLLTRAAKDAAGRADESSKGRVSQRAKGACARLMAPRTPLSRAIGSARCPGTRGGLARDARAILARPSPRDPRDVVRCRSTASVYRRTRRNPKSTGYFSRLFFLMSVSRGASGEKSSANPTD